MKAINLKGYQLEVTFSKHESKTIACGQVIFYKGDYYKSVRGYVFNSPTYCEYKSFSIMIVPFDATKYLEALEHKTLPNIVCIAVKENLDNIKDALAHNVDSVESVYIGDISQVIQDFDFMYHHCEIKDYIYDDDDDDVLFDTHEMIQEMDSEYAGTGKAFHGDLKIVATVAITESVLQEMLENGYDNWLDSVKEGYLGNPPYC